MATKIETTGPVARGDVFRINPEDVILGKNSRIIPNPNYPQTVSALAISILKNGQLQPTRGHKAEDNRVVLDIGHTRYDAVKLIREGFSAVDPDDGETRFFQDRDLQLDVIITRDIKTAEDSFVASIIENSQRENTTDVQEALAQQELREVYHWNNSRIARAYGYANSNRVSFLQQLLTLPQEIVDRVHNKSLTLSAALELKRVPEGEAKESLVASVKAGDTFTAAEIRDVARKEIIESVLPTVETEGGVETPVKSTEKPKVAEKTESKGLSRSVRDFRKFNEELQDENTVAPDVVKKLFAHLEDWFAGTRQDKSLWNVIGEIKGARTTK